MNSTTQTCMLSVIYRPDIGWNQELPTDLDSNQTIVLAFGAPELRDDPKPFEDLCRAFPNSVIAGCSTSGEIHMDAVVDQSLVVAVMKFHKTQIRHAVTKVADLSDSRQAGLGLASQLADPELRGVLVLSDGLQINGSELAIGLNEGLGEVPIGGGLAGDGERFEKTWILVDGKPVAGQVGAVGFYGANIQIECGSQGGWDVFGPERRVTRSEGSTLYEFDGKPALAVYKEYLGNYANELPASAVLFPLAIRTSNEQQGTVRTVLSVDEDAQTMTFAGNIPEGCIAQLMRANFERLVQGAEKSAQLAFSQSTDNTPRLVIAISCVGRRLVLGQRVEEELEGTLEVFPAGSLQVGMYSYGELSSSRCLTCELHNQTMTLMTLHETDRE